MLSKNVYGLSNNTIIKNSESDIKYQIFIKSSVTLNKSVDIIINVKF